MPTLRTVKEDPVYYANYLFLISNTFLTTDGRLTESMRKRGLKFYEHSFNLGEQLLSSVKVDNSSCTEQGDPEEQEGGVRLTLAAREFITRKKRIKEKTQTMFYKFVNCEFIRF